jgi:hypothetical protein
MQELAHVSAIATRQHLERDTLHKQFREQVRIEEETLKGHGLTDEQIKEHTTNLFAQQYQPQCSELLARHMHEVRTLNVGLFSNLRTISSFLVEASPVMPHSAS